MGVLGHLCAIFIPVLGGMAITGSSVKTICIILPIIAVLRGIFHLLEQNRNHYLAFKLLALIRDKVFGALRKLAPAKLEGRDKGNLIAILTADIELLEVFYAHTISPIFIAIFVSIIMTAFIGSFHPALGALALTAYMVVGIVVPVVASKMSKKYGEGFREEFGNLDAFVLDSLRGVKESIQYGTGEKRLKEICEYSDSLSEKEKKLKGAGGTSVAVTSGIMLVFDVLMVLIAAMLLDKGVIDGRSAVVSVIALMSSFGPVIALANLGTGLQNTIAAGNRVLDILDEEPVICEVKNKKDIVFNGADCEDVQFSYDNECILKNEGKHYDVCVAIGPMIMMKFVCLLTKKLGIHTIVSMNPIMVDGTGMCGACRLQVGDEIKFACVDGPEFDGHLVDFDQAMKRSQMYKTQEGRALLKLQEGDTHHGGCGQCGGDK